jgi:hypothetical protein
MGRQAESAAHPAGIDAEVYPGIEAKARNRPR